jgi:hypothetical protein
MTHPFDIGFNGSQVLVTNYGNERKYTVFDVSQFEANAIPGLGAAFSPEWAALNLDPNGNDEDGNGTFEGRISGIVVVPGVGFYLSNEHGQTAIQKSLYGVTDGNSGITGSTFYQDNMFDDNEPIIYVSVPVQVPEPGAIVLAVTALLGFAGYARRQRLLA